VAAGTGTERTEGTEGTEGTGRDQHGGTKITEGGANGPMAAGRRPAKTLE